MTGVAAAREGPLSSRKQSSGKFGTPLIAVCMPLQRTAVAPRWKRDGDHDYAANLQTAG